MARPPKVDHVRDEFINAVDSAVKLYDQVQKVGTVHASTKCERLHAQHVRRVIELAFMGTVSSWEEFIEQTMVRYLAGAAPHSGSRPGLKIGAAKTIRHAYQVLTADPDHDPMKNYISWNNPTAVAKRATLYFDGGAPYATPLKRYEANLQDAVKLRNRVAHSSRKCREDFKLVARRFRNDGPNGRLPQGYRVGDLLLEKAVRHFGTTARNQGLTFFEAYCDLFKAAARDIVP